MTYKHMIVRFCLWSMPVMMGLSCQKSVAVNDYLSLNANFNRLDIYQPFLGRTTYQSNEFNADGSSYPMSFAIDSARHADGTPAPELFVKHRVHVWLRDYTGKETSIDSIESKRGWAEKPFLDIVQGSGDFVFWDAPAGEIRTYPDSGYIFNVKITNKGNERTLENFKLQPLPPQPYAPSEYDNYTGARKMETRTRPDGSSYTVPFVNHPSFMTNMYINKDTLMADSLVSVLIYKSGDLTNSLTFRFLDQQLNPIDPATFKPFNYNILDNGLWEKLVHGFNMVKTNTFVKYTVAYPLPLTSIQTDYAVSGQAHSGFLYSRRGNGGGRIDASFGMDYAIYEPGEWNITFYFRRNPMFEDN